jgi:hypothetical protein
MSPTTERGANSLMLFIYPCFSCSSAKTPKDGNKPIKTDAANKEDFFMCSSFTYIDAAFTLSYAIYDKPVTKKIHK